MSHGRVIDVTTPIDLLTRLVRSLTVLQSLPEEEREKIWDDTRSRQYLEHLYDDTINRHLQWTTDLENAETYLRDWIMDVLIEEYDLINITQLQDLISSLMDEENSLIRVILSEVEDELYDIIDGEVWGMWNLRRVDNTSFYIFNDGDYRIKVYHEKVDSGEWVN